MERHAIFALDGWHGRTETPCVVVGETPARYRVRMTRRSKIGGRRLWAAAGEIVLIPKRAVRFTDQPNH